MYRISRSTVTLLLAAILVAGTATSISAAESPVEQDLILLKNARILDVVAGTSTVPQDILIDKGLITEIGKVKKGKGAQQIDCAGKYVVPGLFDSHTHLAELTTAGGDSLRTQLREFVTHGVLQVRDVGGPVDVLHNMRDRITTGELLGPELYYTGPMLESGELTWGERNKEFPGFTVAINTAEEVDSLLPSLAHQGARMIKTFNRIEPRLYRHVVEVAQRCSLRIVHDPGEPLFNWVPMDSALEMGVTSIEHAKAPWPVVLKDSLRAIHDALIYQEGSQMARMSLMIEIARLGVESVSLDRLHDLARKMKAKRAYLCPTLSVLTDLEEVAIEQVKTQMGVDSVPPPVLEMIRAQTKAMGDVSRLFVREFARDSVPMLVGQDGDDPAGTLQEMKMLQENGVSPLEIIRGATLYPARWLGVDNRLGSIAVGKQANLVICDKDPLQDVGNLESGALVIVDGKPIAKQAK